jgi:hypothetical protein
LNSNAVIYLRASKSSGAPPERPAAVRDDFDRPQRTASRRDGPEDRLAFFALVPSGEIVLSPSKYTRHVTRFHGD